MVNVKKNKNDEFYTNTNDIVNELNHYRDYFKGKVVYLNCDDPKESHFWFYFKARFESLGLKKLIATHYSRRRKVYKLELEKGIETMTPLKANGDFRNKESIVSLEECDIVVTNPPISLFRECVSLILKYDKDLLLIGNMNAIIYKDVFPYIKQEKLWLGITTPKTFRKPDGTTKTFGNLCWFTNLSHYKRREELILRKKYIPIEYPKYDNYNAINVNKVIDIPIDYAGTMGVPVSYFNKHCPEQFEILGCTRGHGQDPDGIYGKNPYIDGRLVFKRLFIRNKRLNDID